MRTNGPVLFVVEPVDDPKEVPVDDSPALASIDTAEPEKNGDAILAMDEPQVEEEQAVILELTDIEESEDLGKIAWCDT